MHKNWCNIGIRKDLKEKLRALRDNNRKETYSELIARLLEKKEDEEFQNIIDSVSDEDNL